MNAVIREIPLHSPFQCQRLAAFLAAQGLLLDELDFAVGIHDEDTDELLACGGCSGNILKDFAVSPEARGQNLLGQILSGVIRYEIEQGQTWLRVFTKPENCKFFTANGFYLVEAAERAALLENIPGGPAAFCAETAAKVAASSAGAPVGCIVMNANPVTRGHVHLVREAAAQCRRLFVFVVEENRSFFPFGLRYELVFRAVGTIPNVCILPSGPYMISSATFPGYFIKDATTIDATRSELDVRIFARHIAPGLGISHRFVGTEPECTETSAYNQALAKILPEHGINLHVLPRLNAGPAPISASAVRALLVKKGPDAPELAQYLDATTLTWLKSEGQEQLPPLLAQARKGSATIHSQHKEEPCWH